MGKIFKYNLIIKTIILLTGSIIILLLINLFIIKIIDYHQALKLILLRGGFDAEITVNSIIKIISEPIGIILVSAISIIIEIKIIGYEKSSLRRLLDPQKKSSKNDIFYLLLRVSGLIDLLAILFSFGLCFYLENQIKSKFTLGLFINTPLILQVPFYIAIQTLIFYWLHRLMHTKYLWEIHKIHHSAEDLNIITTTRNHPLDRAIMIIAYAVPVAIFGFDGIMILIYAILNAFYQSFAHSGINMDSTLLNKIFITSNAHAVHHSNHPADWGKNFGVLTIWDFVFGTYKSPKIGKLQYGVSDNHLYNSGNSFKEILNAFIRQINIILTSFYSGK